MKVSRLIELLQEFRRDYGDLECFASKGEITEVNRVNDPDPLNEGGDYYSAGVCLIEGD